MIYNSEIEFKRGKILTTEILEEVYQFPRIYFDILYEDYPDGIIEGFNLFNENNDIYLSKGIVKFKGNIYFSGDKLKISNDNFCEGAPPIYLYLEEGPTFERNGVKMNPLIVSFYNQKNDLGIYLGHFKYREGILIKTGYAELKDLYDPLFINIVDRKISVKKGYSLDKEILKILSKALMKKTVLTMEEKILISLIESESVSIDYLKFFLSSFNLESETNLSIVKSLEKIILEKAELTQNSNGNKVEVSKSSQPRKSIRDVQ